MAKRCPRCSCDNPDNSVFCIRCGDKFEQTGTMGSPSTAGSAGIQGGPSSNPLPPYAPPPPPVAQPGVSAQAGYPVAAGGGAVHGPVSMQMGTVTPGPEGDVTIRRAFAGHGTTITNHSWLLRGDAARARDLLVTTLTMLQQRSILGLTVTPTRLKERGVQMEEREYIMMRRGVTTEFIYIAPAGQDLYISRTTTVLPAINAFRVMLLILWLGIALFGPAFLQSVFPGYLGLLLAGALSFINFLFFWVPLIIFLVRSTIQLALEKDFWVYLRSRDLNDFQLDDVSLLEHVTDDTLKEAVKQIGLDASKIAPPPQGYQPKQRIRAI